VTDAQLPPDDQPGVLWIGLVGPIPVFPNDDFRLDADKAARAAAAATADAMRSADELLAGLRHQDEDVRWRVVDRLVARARDDARTGPASISALRDDASWKVRDKVAITMSSFREAEFCAALVQALSDQNKDVRWAASFALRQPGAEPTLPE
jgi:HEAT repeat protein